MLTFVYMSGCDASLTDTNFQCPNHKHENTTNQTPLALRSLPPEVQLCASSIPGTGFGICAKRAFPVGAWIGPYEGTFVKPEELSSVKDTSYMWEVSVIVSHNISFLYAGSFVLTTHQNSQQKHATGTKCKGHA